MSTTSTVITSLQQALNNALPGIIDTALAQVGLGSVLTPTAQTITPAVAAGPTGVTGVTLPAPGILMCGSVRVVTGATGTAAGVYVVSDVGATPLYPTTTAPGVVRLSADGRVLTFPCQANILVAAYIPRSAVDVSTAFANNDPTR